MVMNKLRGKRIKELMEAQGLTREKLASMSGFSLSAIARARAGYDFNTDFQSVICQILNTTPNFLNGYETHSTQVEIIINELAKANSPELTQIVLDVTTLFNKK